MSKKTETNPNNSSYTNEHNINNYSNNNIDFQESINQSFDETKDNIKKSIDESRKQIPRINDIVNNYQEQSLQTAKEISEEYIDSQKEVVNSLQSAWRPYNEAFNGLVTNFCTPDAAVKAYSTFVSTVADNTVSAIRLSNNVIFSTLDAWKPVLQQTKDFARHISNTGVNAARTFEQNSRQIAADVKDVTADSNVNASTTSTTTTKSTSH
jgi:F0F1-type ATP synthase membrane subunit b/b'